MKGSETHIERLSSAKNPRIKNFLALQKSKERNRQGLFVVEGRREVIRALSSGFLADHLFFCSEIISPEELQEIIALTKNGTSLFSLTESVYDHIAYRGGVEGIVGWFKMKTTELDDLSLSGNPLILVLESVEKPGNLGAILRTTDASGADAVIVCDPRTDIFNPNVIRSSLGAVFSSQLVTADSKEVIDWLKKKQITIYCTALNASHPYTEANLALPSAIVLGTESTGLSDQWLNAADRNIIIPMHGTVDSMNVSVSAAIVLFEAVRQRKI